MKCITVYDESLDSCYCDENPNNLPKEVIDILNEITVYLYNFTSPLIKINWDVEKQENGYFIVICEGYNRKLVQYYYELVLEENPVFDNILII